MTDMEVVTKVPPKIKGARFSDIKGMRSDAKRSLKMVSRELMKDPDMSMADLKRATGLSETAVRRALNNMRTYMEKDESIIAITDRDLAIVWMGQQELHERMSDPEQMKKIRTTDLATIMEKSEKRYMLFRGEMTNSEGGLKRIENIEIV